MESLILFVMFIAYWYCCLKYRISSLVVAIVVAVSDAHRLVNNAYALNSRYKNVARSADTIFNSWYFGFQHFRERDDGHVDNLMCVYIHICVKKK